MERRPPSRKNSYSFNCPCLNRSLLSSDCRVPLCTSSLFLRPLPCILAPGTTTLGTHPPSTMTPNEGSLWDASTLWRGGVRCPRGLVQHPFRQERRIPGPPPSLPAPVKVPSRQSPNSQHGTAGGFQTPLFQSIYFYSNL